MSSLKGRDLLAVRDLTAEEVAALLDRAADVKKNPRAYGKALDGRTLAMIFQKPSLRTRVTFETGMTQLHGHAIYISPGDAGLGTRESVADVARNLDRWVDGIMARVFAHRLVEDLAEHARVPVVNGLSDDHHPVQALSDLLTIKERVGRLTGTRLAYVGDGNNVAHSLLEAAARTGLSIACACPDGYEPSAAVVSWAREAGRETGCRVTITDDPRAAVAEAQFVYTDVWASMGQESEAQKRRGVFARYQVNADLMRAAGTDPYLLHCLPAHRGEEVTDEVADGPRSLIFDQAENRLHVQKALLVELMGG